MVSSEVVSLSSEIDFSKVRVDWVNSVLIIEI